MIQFVKGSELSHSLEEMIENADKLLWLISPFIKLSGRIKDVLKPLKKNDAVQITIVYGKNESDKSKSLSKEDFEFLKEFPNIRIYYEKNLHAKYYANENFSLLCSMNLHEFSQNTNIEAGVRFTPKDIISGTISSTLSYSDPEVNAHQYFLNIIENSDVEFLKKPNYKKGLLGLTSSYIDSTIIHDTSSTKSIVTNEKHKDINHNGFSQSEFLAMSNAANETGYCIRTGKEIPFDITRPLCYESYKSWAQYQNPDFPEKFCHATGKPSYGKTSMRQPILK